MTPLSPERLRQVETLFHQVLDRDPAERASFLAVACGEDSELRREVESLIASSAKDSAVLVTPSMRRLGNYEIRGLLGVGGMGEVYRAYDARLRREVAIKVLPPGVTDDPGRLARFEREARALASVSHANIAAIYGIEDLGGQNGHVTALVLELVEGETLADRLERSGALKVDDAVRIASQLVDALEAAHSKGVIHRDLKPANIKLGPGGTVKVLDFGLAKTDNGAFRAGDTQTAATADGVIVGTPAYMSPEQARGQNADKRTDVWAFGCVLFEMLTGRAAFSGDTATDTIAAVIERDPDWSKLPATTPPPLRRLLQWTLAKDLRHRLREIPDVRPLLADVTAPAVEQPRVWTKRVGAVLVAALIAAVAIGFAMWRFSSVATAPVPISRFAIELPPGEPLVAFGTITMAASPDGRYVAFTTMRDGIPTLYVRAMDGSEARLVSNDFAGQPFFSPDSKWIGFVAGGKLRKQRVEGGAAVELAPAGTGRGGSWAEGGFIVFAADSRSGLSRIPADGGTVTALTRLDTDSADTSHRAPEVLPGSRGVIFRAEGTGTEGHIDAFDIETGQRRVLVNDPDAFEPHYANGHLLYRIGTSVMAAPFDVRRLELSGPAVVVQQHVQAFTVSAAGLLLYAGEDNATRQLVWFDRRGVATPLPLPPDRYDVPRLSPDKKHVLLNIDDRTQSGRSIWRYDLGTDRLTRLTSDGANLWPVWTSDGKRVVYAANNARTVFDVFIRSADESGKPMPLVVKPGIQIPRDISKHDLLVYGDGAGQFVDLWLMPVNGDQPPRRFIRNAGDSVAFSPDGRWLAYTTRDSGRVEVYVGCSDGAAGNWKVSTDGGNAPRWNPNGRELFYRQGNRMLAVGVTEGNGLTFGKPVVLFDNPRLVVGIVGTNYDVDADGQRFLAVTQDPKAENSRSFQVTSGWFQELNRLSPVQ